jgi:hypothetical protein
LNILRSAFTFGALLLTTGLASAQSIGDKCVVKDWTLAADTKEHYEEMCKQAMARDTFGTKEMIKKKQALQVPMGTSALVIDNPGLAIKKIRLLDGPYKNSAWIVPVEYLQVQTKGSR